jgi:hypothetical protein
VPSIRDRVKAQIRRWQDRVLDLTKSNPLIGLNRSRVAQTSGRRTHMHHSMLAVVLREFVAETPSPTEHLMGLFVAAVPENIGYRQVRNLWLIAGLIGLGGGGTRKSRRVRHTNKARLAID